ncbi:protein BatD [Parabacteroides sp. 52]|uniref:BatD family protein n=1 Tax=unclassified Parabacteroides TaxID=2649774 RepID=UPI0013D784DD|nr:MULTISPECIES: BatD family protein [unclassified Parabacteroides]MDH6533380.1 hypothetical protein [Parabacteroides sp. PM5-20]NDV54138.1 protein BatD [Parabacteroides sp. 52]
MRKIIFLFILIVATGITYLQAADVVFKAIAPEAVVVGEQFRLTYTVNAEAKDLRVQGEMSDFDVLMGPTPSTSYSSSWVNGKSSSEVSNSFTYILMAKKEGTFNLPPATIKVNNSTYTSNGVTVRVLPQDKVNEAASQNQGNASGVSDKDIFMRMHVSSRNVFEQEAILVSFKLYFIVAPAIENLKFPEFEGFWVQEIEQSKDGIQTKLENYNGRNYQTAVLKQVLLFPQRPGKLTIEGGTYDVNVRVARPQQRSRSLFDDLFDNMYTNVKKTLTTSPVTIDVKTLPSGKPASFSGDVGNYTMTSSINATNLKANEAITIKVKIAGTGNIKLIKSPEVKFPNDFDIYDPKVTPDVKITSAGVSGSKTIEYMAIPRFGGDFEIPAIQFSYFDPKAGSYKTLNSEPYKIHVEKGEGDVAAGPAVTNFTNRENVRFLGQDIRFLKVKGVSFVSTDDIFFGSFMYYMCYLIPALLFIVFFFIYRKQIKDNANIALVRTKKANKMAVKRLKNAGKLMKENKKEAFYDEVLRALWGYLSDKLNIPQSALSKDNVETELSKYGVDEVLIREFMDILNTCEFARYAPSQASDAMDKLYELTVDAIGKMENTIKK